MKEFEITQFLFEVAYDAATEDYERIKVSYKVEKLEDGMGGWLDSPTLKFYSEDKDGKKSSFLNRKRDFFSVIKNGFEELRAVMLAEQENNVSWEEAIMTYEKGGRVKMSYVYP